MDSAEALVGRSLGRYRITALVGKGGMATVYKAEHPGLGQTVAIKVLHPHMATDQDMLARFRHEAQAVANLRHPNIVRVLDFDVQNDQYFMVMEYVDGPTLAAQLNGFAAQGRRMPTAEVARIFEPLCAAVDYAHGLGMIHRDIKPANVLLTPQGEPVLTDYGIAKMVGVTQHTATGTVMGSAYYMSPEQAQGSGIDGRTDIYSLGVMLFEMLTGRVPYEGDTLATVLVKHITAPVPAVCRFNTQLPPLLDDVMNVALAKDPAQRFQTGQALSAALRQGLTAPSAVAGQTTLERGTHGATVAAAAGVASVSARTAGRESLAARTTARDVYISYAAADRQAAEAVCARLEAEDVTCWIAPRDVLPGRSFAQSLSGAIHAARVFVLVFSDATNESQQVERELHMADAARLPVVPVRVQDVQPHESIEYYLAGRSWVEASDPPLDARLGLLVETVSLLLLQTPLRQAHAAPGEATTMEPGSAAAAAAVSGPTAAQPAATVAEVAASTAAAAAVAAAAAPPAAPPAAAPPVVAAPAGGPSATTVETRPSEAAPPAPPEAEAAAVPEAPPAEEPPSVATGEAPPPAAPPVAGPSATTVETPAPASTATTLEPAAPPAAVAAAAAAAVTGATVATAAAAEPVPASPAATTVEPVATAVAATTVEPATRGPAPTTVEPPAAGVGPAPTTVEAPPPRAAASPTTVEAPSAAAAAGATVLDPGARAAAAPGPSAQVPSQPAVRQEEAGLPSTFRTRAVAAAAVVGVGWVVLLYVLERFVL